MGGSGGVRRSTVGTTADALSRSWRMRPSIASARALSGGSRTVMNPSGLSSRTISPVSVIQAVVLRPANSISTRKAGIGAFAARTISRSPTVTVTGAFRKVAGSKTFHGGSIQASSPRSASRRTRFSASMGVRATGELRSCVRPSLVIERWRSRSRTSPAIVIGPVPGSSANSNDCSSNARFTRALVRSVVIVCAPSSAICS